MRIKPEADFSSTNDWILIKHYGRPISATRGDYQITGADITGNTLLIQESNNNQQLQYTWLIAIEDGTFQGQTMSELDQLIPQTDAENYAEK